MGSKLALADLGCISYKVDRRSIIIFSHDFSWVVIRVAPVCRERSGML